jgi:hypothetical protein
MRITIVVLLTFLLFLVVSTPLLAKEKTSKITISGAGLNTPIEISDPNVLANFRVWAGPGTSSNEGQGLIIDWSQGTVTETPNTLRRYQVSFYAGSPAHERIVYVVYYVLNPDAGPGYVYLPGESDEWYGVNVHSIGRGVEGKWFRAWNAWERVARPLIEKAERTNSIQPRYLLIKSRYRTSLTMSALSNCFCASFSVHSWERSFALLF